jgi:hypothetical protein
MQYLWSATVILCALRFLITVNMSQHLINSYAAVSHLFLGGLIGAWFVNRKAELLVMSIALTAVETIAFLNKNGVSLIFW